MVRVDRYGRGARLFWATARRGKSK